MTNLLGVSDVAAGRFQSGAEMFSGSAARARERRPDAKMKLLMTAARTIGACGGRLLAALRESRQREAAREIARYRHLIGEPEAEAVSAASRRSTTRNER